MNARNSQYAAANFAAAFLLTFSLFAFWGLGHRLYDTLLPQFAKTFELQGFPLALTRGIYSIVYFLGAIPAALCARRFGYKAAVLFGLGSIGVGAFVLYPATEMHAYAYFLFAATVMSCGWILLEIAANPLVAALGPVETSVQRLNLAQSFFPFGALLGVFAGRWLVASNLALPHERFAYSIAHPYIVIGAVVVLLAYAYDGARFPSVATEQARGLYGVAGEFRTLLRNRLFQLAMAAQFFGVMVMAGTWGESGRYFQAAFPGVSSEAFGGVFVWCLVAFAIGRVAGTALMYRIEPERLLVLFAGGGLLMSAIAVTAGGPLGMICVIASNFFMSITWPTVVGTAIRGRGQMMKLGTAILYMAAGVGGVAYRLLTAVWTMSAVEYTMVVPAVSYAVIMAYGVMAERVRAKSLVERCQPADLVIAD